MLLLILKCLKTCPILVLGNNMLNAFSECFGIWIVGILVFGFFYGVATEYDFDNNKIPPYCVFIWPIAVPYVLVLYVLKMFKEVKL